MPLFYPCVMQVPDNRCLGRLLKTMSCTSNMFAHVIPLHVKHILNTVDISNLANVEDQIIFEWWKHNEKTSFFSSSATAQSVRSYLKKTALIASSNEL